MEGLPPEAPETSPLVTVDVSTNTAYLFLAGELVTKARVATGSDTLLRKGARVWLFRTPRGRHQVVRKIVDPVWTKPDWAFVEEGRKIPPADSAQRRVRGKLGKFALDLGGGILIHGTDDPKSFGQRASHGCIRMPHAMLKQVFALSDVGMDVYIFDSEPSMTSAWREGVSDLELLR
ncbi:MAG TPA: L,D-transpeptidase [Acidimicrobiia bacterium]|nr:L,D-transpeptidase [Acidimicrobiia bacterium]